MTDNATLMRRISLNDRGVAVLEAMARYIVSHGNVATEARDAAHILLSLLGRSVTEANPIVFGEEAQKLRVAMREIRKS